MASQFRDRTANAARTSAQKISPNQSGDTEGGSPVCSDVSILHDSPKPGTVLPGGMDAWASHFRSMSNTSTMPANAKTAIGACSMLWVPVASMSVRLSCWK